MNWIPFITVLSLIICDPLRADNAPATMPAARHVLLIGLDGARPDALREHAGPVLQSLLRNATCCWQAKAVRPSITEVNWPSILSGASPVSHGIDHHYLSAEELASVSLKVPTIFEILAQHHLTSAAFLGHWKLYTLQNNLPECHFEKITTGSHDTGLAAAKLLRTHAPDFTFVYFGDLDGVGHTHGWMSPEYLTAIPKLDGPLSLLLDALRDAHLTQSTDILITSDHGGSGKQHALGTPDDMHIPWIATGPDFHNATLPNELSTLTTTPTILSIFHIEPPSTCQAVPLDLLLPSGNKPR